MIARITAVSTTVSRAASTGGTGIGTSGCSGAAAGVTCGAAGAALLVDSWLGIAVASADLTAKWHLFAALESPLGVYPGGKPTFPATVPSFGSRRVARRILNGAVFATDDGGRSWTALGQLLSADGKVRNVSVDAESGAMN